MNAIHREILANGLALVVAEDHTLPIVCCTIWYRCGTRTEPGSQTGVSHFLEHMAFKGTPRWPKGAIDDVTLRLGGNNNAFTSYDYTGYYFTFSADRWKVALDIEADRMRNLLLDPAEFEAERQVVLEELDMGEDSPWESLRRNVSLLAYARHPYRIPIIGFREDLESLTPEDMREYYRTHYRPAGAVLVITGDVKADEVSREVRTRFGRMKGAPIPEPTLPAEPPLEGILRFRSARTGRVPRMVAAFRAPSVREPAVYSANVLRYVLGEGKTSRLYRRLVEEDRTVTSLSISFEDMKDPSLFILSVELCADATFEEVEKSLFEEVTKLRAEGITPAEHARALRQLQADFVFEQEDVSGVAVNLGLYECIGQGDFYLTFPEKISAVTPEDVREAARTFLDPGRCVLATMAAAPAGEEPDEDEMDEDEDDGSSAQPGPTGTWKGYRRSAPIRPASQSSQGVGVGVHLPVESHVLDNGLTVLLCPLHRIPAVTLTGVVLAGSREDVPGREGLANLVGSMLDEGTRQRDHEAIATLADDLGATLDTFCQRDGSGASLRLLKEDLDQGLDLLQELLYESVFPDERLELVRTQALGRMDSLEDRPEYVGEREFKKLLYAGTPLAAPTLGYREPLCAIGREELSAFHRRYYHPANTILVLVGDLEPTEVLERIRKTWGGRAAGERHVRSPLTLVRPDHKVTRRLPMPHKEQLHLFLGHLGVRRADPDYYRLLVLDVILGGGPGFTSRIPRKLRDEMGLAYNTYASITQSAGLDEGRFEAYIATSPENRRAALDGMLDEIRRIRDERVGEEELQAARDYLTGSFVFKFETMSQVASYLLAAHMYGLGFDYPDRFPGLINSVTAEDVQEAACRWLDPERYILVETGPSAGSRKAPGTR